MNIRIGEIAFGFAEAKSAGDPLQDRAAAFDRISEIGNGMCRTQPC
jgi:hypothetical protein